MTEKLITKAARQLTEKEFSQIASLDDGAGISSTMFVRESTGEKYIMVAKKYAYKNLASFQKRQVRLACKEDLELIFYENKNESFTVFDPHRVASIADDSVGKSKQEMEEWKELSLSEGQPLDEYLNGVKMTTDAGDTTLSSWA